jgi:hypothetical protein
MTPTQQEELLEGLSVLMRHRDIAKMIQEQEIIEARAVAQQKWNEEQRQRREVVVTDDVPPAPGHVFTRMSDDELRLAISRLKDESVKDGDTTRLRLAESVLNDRALERQRQLLKSGAESMTAFQR